MGYVASVSLAPQAPLAGVQIEPDVVTGPPTLGDDPADQAAPLRGAALAGLIDRIGQREAALISRATRGRLRPDHRLGDPFFGESRGHESRCRAVRAEAAGRLHPYALDQRGQLVDTDEAPRL